MTVHLDHVVNVDNEDDHIEDFGTILRRNMWRTYHPQVLLRPCFGIFLLPGQFTFIPILAILFVGFKPPHNVDP